MSPRATGAAKDAVAGPAYVELLAQIYAMVGKDDLALEQIEILLTNPSWFSAALLEKDPRWDSLRNNPRYQAMLERRRADPGAER